MTHPIQLLTARAAPDTSIISGADPTVVSTSDPIRLFIIQASIIIIFTRILAYFLGKIRQPAVIAEVIGGILLGPTVFGRIPGFTEHIFPTGSIPYLNLVANLGLVLFLFLVGLEIDTRIVRKCKVSSTAISLVGLAVPFALGVAVSVGIYRQFIDQRAVSLGHFLLFTGVAMAITALPVLARIVIDLKLIKTRVGVVVLAAGVGNDVVGWILLALAIALVNASSGLNALYIFLVVVAWTLILFFAVRPAFVYLAKRDGSLYNGPTHTMMTLTILLVFASAFLTDCIGVHAIFGAFLVGLIIPHQDGFAVALTEKLEDMVTVIFLPLYFAFSGLRTNLATLDSGIIWGYIIAICLIAFFSKFLACAAAARMTGFNNREAAAIGTLMSCKGLVELIVLNLGLNAGILDTRVFSMFVVMALVSTCATTPLTMLVYPKQYHVDFDEHEKRRTKGTDDGTDEHPSKVDGTLGKLAPQRYLFVLDRFETLPGLLAMVQILRPTSDAHLRQSHGPLAPSSALRRRQRQSSSGEKADTTNASTEGGHESEAGQIDLLYETRPSTPTPTIRTPAQVDAVRLVELTQRTSAVMRIAESDETIRADPLTNVFRAFVRLNRLPFHSTLQAVPSDEFSSTITHRAIACKTDLVVVPWALPTTGLLGNDVGAPARSRGAVDSFLTSATAERGETTQHYQAAFVRRLVQTSPCHVGMLLERGATEREQPSGWAQHIMFAFMGGPDDRCALDLLQRWCRVNGDMHATVFRYRKADAESNVNDPRTPPMTLQNVDTIHRETATTALYGQLSVHDTMYPRSNLNPLQAQLEDDVAIDRLDKALKDDVNLAARLHLHECTTATPLAHLIELIGRATVGGHLGADSEAVPPVSMVLLGRNRRLPTISHRDELRGLLRNLERKGLVDGTEQTAGPSTNAVSPVSSLEARLIDGEMSKIIGQAAMAVCGVGRCALPTLVVASSLQYLAVGEQDE